MSGLDPRLLRRARGVRVLLGADAALGVVAALLVLVQAALLAHVAARAFGGASLASLGLPLVLLGRRRSGTRRRGVGLRGCREARSDDRALGAATRPRRAAAARPAGGARRRARAPRSRRSPSPASTRSRRRSPATCHSSCSRWSCRSPSSCFVASIDLVSAGVMLLTLPLVPVFMWLVGRYTERRARARWRALGAAREHFARRRPRAADAPCVQPRRGADGADRARSATSTAARRWARFGSRFSRGAVLELAATLGIALVAVTVGVRLVDGRHRLRGGPDRPRACAGALPAVAEPRGPVPRERRRPRGHRAPPRAARGGADDLRSGGHVPPSPRDAPVRLEGVSFAYPSRPELVLDAIDLELAAGETVALVGPSGSGKSTIASLLLRLVEPTGGRVTVGAVDLASCDAAAWRAQIAWVPQRPTLFRGTVADNIRLGDPRGGRRARAGPRPRSPAPTASSASCPTATRPSSATAAARSRPASCSGSRSRARSCATRRSSSSTSPRRTSIPRAPSSSARRSSGCGEGRTLLLIAHRPELAAARGPGRTLAAGRIVEPRRRPHDAVAPTRRRRSRACRGRAPRSRSCSAPWPWASASR